MKKRIRLSEGALHNIIKNCVNEALNELAPETYMSYSNKRREQGRNMNLDPTTFDSHKQSEYYKKSMDGRNAAIKAWNNQYSKNDPNNHMWMEDDRVDNNINYRGGNDMNGHFNDISVSDKNKNGEMISHPTVYQGMVNPNDNLDRRETVYNPTNDKIRFTQQGTWTKAGGSKGAYASKLNGFPEHLQTAKRMFSNDPSQYYVKGKGYQGY